MENSHFSIIKHIVKAKIKNFGLIVGYLTDDELFLFKTKILIYCKFY